MYNRRDTQNKEKRVVKRLSYKERIGDLTRIIRELGLWRLPSQQRLAERYGVSQQQISKDVARIFTTIPKRVLDEIFFEFFSADQKAQNELRKILNEGTTDEKLRAISVMIQLQNAFTSLLEKYGKKPVVPDKIELEDKTFKYTWKDVEKHTKKYEKMLEKLTEEEREMLKDGFFTTLMERDKYKKMCEEENLI